MLANNQKNDDLYKEICLLMNSIGLIPVEISLSQTGKNISLKVYLYRKEREIDTEDLEKAYNILYPRYSVIFGDRDLDMEVTSPGLQRNFKDYSEFEIFTGKEVRVYSTKYSSYVVGKIQSATDSSVTLNDYLIEDRKETGAEMSLNFTDIPKAKLEYRWESKNA